MSQSQVGAHATTIFVENGWTHVKYHATSVVKFNDDTIMLDSGGYRTVTTKRRMNQAAVQFDLGFQVFQKGYEWFVQVDLPPAGSAVHNFEDGIYLSRR